MYFAWLETYTKALAWASIIGIPTMMNQWLTEGGVDQNGATLVYSVLLSVWSVLFLSVWKRREAELAFLWGSEGFEASQLPRKQFKGVIQVTCPLTSPIIMFLFRLPLLSYCAHFSLIAL